MNEPQGLAISAIPEPYRPAARQAFEQGCTARMRRKHIAIFVPLSKKTVVIPVSPSSHFGPAMFAADLRRAGLTINGRSTHVSVDVAALERMTAEASMPSTPAPRRTASKTPTLPRAQWAAKGQRERQILDLLAQAGPAGLSTGALAHTFGISRNNAITQLRRLQQLGRIQRHQGSDQWTRPLPAEAEIVVSTLGGPFRAFDTPSQAPVSPPDAVPDAEATLPAEAPLAPAVPDLRAFWRHASAALLELAQWAEAQGR